MANMSAAVRDVTDATFDAEIVEASHRVPVVVDFWAPWCAPCKALAPILEKLAAEHEGAFVLAKLNTDENPQTSSRFGIRGIPAVKGFSEGKVAAEFTGAVPESAVRAFLKRILPTPGEKLRRAAAAALAQGDADTAERRLRDALAAEPQLHAARVDLAELLVAREAWPDADEVLSEVPDHERDDRAQELASRIALWKAARALPTAAELRAQLGRTPGDPALRLRLAERLAADGEFEAALEQLLEVIRGDRGPAREAARKTMLQVFALAGGDPELVGRYRRLLASSLN
jgi:putative thioredoxin